MPWAQSEEKGLNRLEERSGPDYPRKFWVIGSVLMLAAMTWRWADSFPKLLWSKDWSAAYDLKSRHLEVATWFSGSPVYGVIESADYPMASYVLLWPFMGWLSLTSSRWLWGALAVLALLGTGYLLIRETKAADRREQLFVFLLPLSFYPLSSGLSMGQMITHLLPLLLISLLRLDREGASWGRDALSAILFLLSLVKPQIAAPFFWILLFRPGRFRPAAMVLSGYVLLTMLAISFQPAGAADLFRGWLSQRGMVHWEDGYASVYFWVKSLGKDSLAMPASLLVLGLLGAWVWRRRRGDPWLLLGVAACVSRLWVHHRIYDDLIVLVAMVALYRAARWMPRALEARTAAALLFFLNWATMLAPVSGVLNVARMTWFGQLVTTWLSLLWLSTLGFLIYLDALDNRGIYCLGRKGEDV